jgi:hypothetical protein
LLSLVINIFVWGRKLKFYDTHANQGLQIQQSGICFRLGQRLRLIISAVLAVVVTPTGPSAKEKATSSHRLGSSSECLRDQKLLSSV